LPHIGQDTITTEDIRFRAYLDGKGWDTGKLGLGKGMEAGQAREVEGYAEGVEGKEKL